MTLQEAAEQLQAIRNEAARRSTSTDYDALRARCDAVGRWLAKQKTTKRVAALLSESHHTYCTINRQQET